MPSNELTGFLTHTQLVAGATLVETRVSMTKDRLLDNRTPHHLKEYIAALAEAVGFYRGACAMLRIGAAAPRVMLDSWMQRADEYDKLRHMHDKTPLPANRPGRWRDGDPPE